MPPDISQTASFPLPEHTILEQQTPRHPVCQPPVVRYHHERWNGTGYPEGLQGQGIPLSARIVAVADSFDAMTTQRIYQDPISGEEAISWIRTDGGSSFDPEVVLAFIQAYDAGEVEPPVTSREPSGKRSAVAVTLHT